MSDPSRTLEADATRKSRQALRRSQGKDPLQERVRIMNFWRACSVQNRHYLPFKGAWWHPFITQPGFRHLLMPRLRAMLDQRARAHRAAHEASMRASSLKWAAAKAERAAAKARAAAPQRDLLDEVAAC